MKNVPAVKGRRVLHSTAQKQFAARILPKVLIRTKESVILSAGRNFSEFLYLDDQTTEGKLENIEIQRDPWEYCDGYSRGSFYTILREMEIKV